MSAEDKNTTPVDPFEAFREMRDSYLDAMSKVIIDAVNSEEYAQATGTLLSSSLKAAAPFREVLDKAMAAALQQSSMPSRQEVASLAGRFTNVEMRLDDMEAKLDRIVELCSAAQTVPAVSGSNAKPVVKQAATTKGKTPQRASRRKG
jgi:predicted dinucleotide-binding enzyme